MPQTPLFQTNGETYVHVGAGTTVVKAAAGYMDRIVINNVTSGATFVLYDNPTAGSGTVIASGAIGTTGNPTSVVYTLNFKTGLTIVATGTFDATIMIR